MSNNYPSTYDGLLQLLQDLRGPDGCPWDREQTSDSLKRQFLEECYELLEAIDQRDNRKLVEELGDVMLHLAFQLQIGVEAGTLTQERVFQTLIEKLVRRHPHVFGDAEAGDAREVESNWEAIKRTERAEADTSLLEGVPKGMPCLAYAQTMQVRAARTGFDWDDFRGVLAKVAEELEELDTVESALERERELGDLLFSIVNAARWLGVDAEGALRQSNARFFLRFATMERLSRERGQSFPDLSLDEKESLWQQAKTLEG